MANTDAGNAAYDSESDTDLSELSDDDGSLGSLNSDDSESDFHAMTPAEKAEHEAFGSDYVGPSLSDKHASRLLILMSHASTCPCHHSSAEHEEICKSAKFMMLHVRDCPGTTSTLDVCPFPWCRKVKHLLYHLVSCKDPDNCPICSPKDIPKNFKDLVGLNAHRMKKNRKSMIAAAKASMKADRSKISQAAKHQPASIALKVSTPRKLVSVAPAPVAKATPGSAAMKRKPSNGSVHARPTKPTASHSKKATAQKPGTNNGATAKDGQDSQESPTLDSALATSALSVPDPTNVSTGLDRKSVV